MELSEIAFASIRKHTAGLAVEISSPSFGFKVFSGFVVKLDNGWVWVTAGHIIDALRKVDVTSSHFSWATNVYEDKNYIPMTFEIDKFVDLRDRIKIPVEQLKNIEGLTTNHVFDLGLYPISDIDMCYMIERGIKPLSLDQMAPTQELVNQFRSNGWCTYIAGYPSKLTNTDLKNKQTTIGFRVFPLEPLNEPSPPFVRLKPSWDVNQFDHSVEGVSGGPLFAVNATGEVLIIGVQILEKGKEDRVPSLLTSVSTEMYFGILKEIIAEGGEYKGMSKSDPPASPTTEGID